jgi:hypothetical protein
MTTNNAHALAGMSFFDDIWLYGLIVFTTLNYKLKLKSKGIIKAAALMQRKISCHCWCCHQQKLYRSANRSLLIIKVVGDNTNNGGRSIGNAG